MTQPNGQGAVPLRVPNLQKPELHHYLVSVRRGEATEIHDYLVSGYSMDPVGNLHLVINQSIVHSFAAGQWLEVGRPDIVADIV